MNKQNRHHIFIHAILLFLFLFFTGCGSETNEIVKESEQDNRITYTVRETAIPDPDETLAEFLQEEGSVKELDFLFREDKVYRLAQIWGKMDGLDVTQGYYIQILEPPYDSWKNYKVTGQCWDETIEWDYYSIWNLYDITNGQIYCNVKNYENKTNYLGLWNANGKGELLCTMPDALGDKSLVVNPQGGFYAFTQYGTSLTLLDDQLQERKRCVTQSQIYGILENPENGETFWYGTNASGSGIWRISDETAITDDFQEKIKEIGFDFEAAFSENGELYIADKEHLWRCDENGDPLLLCDFLEKGYFMDTLYGITVQTDGSIIVLAKYEGNLHILTLREHEGALLEKQTIVLATAYSVHPILQQSVAQFNRQSDSYFVELVFPQPEEKLDDFMEDIQIGITTGKGPDIILSGNLSLIDPADYARNGYIQSVEGILTDQDAYWQAALDCGIIDGVHYGIPYECTLQFATYSRQLTGGRSCWTLPEMMEAVRASDAVMLQPGLSGLEIVLYYGLSDNDNKSFIDWEEGESHLTETPFLDFLAFAKQYADNGNYRDEELGSMLQEGKFAAQVQIGNLGRLNGLDYLEACFQGEPACIGFPRTVGNGIYVAADCFYLNSSTDRKEGCAELIRFLLSEQTQKNYVSDVTDPDFLTPTRPHLLAPRLSALEREIALEKSKKRDTNVETNGIRFSSQGITDEQEEIFRFLLENSRPGNWNASEIFSIVSEELQPYFQGDRTAEEAAAILDNRVQLYLDEKK